MDRRQKKTRNAIYAAFEDLMAKEHYQKLRLHALLKQLISDAARFTLILKPKMNCSIKYAPKYSITFLRE